MYVCGKEAFQGIARDRPARSTGGELGSAAGIRAEVSPGPGGKCVCVYVCD